MDTVSDDDDDVVVLLPWLGVAMVSVMVHSATRNSSSVIKRRHWVNITMLLAVLLRDDR